MASSGKKKTTMAKLNRESRLRERRLDKQARKDARKYASAHPEETPADPTGESALADGPSPQPDGGAPQRNGTKAAAGADVPALADA